MRTPSKACGRIPGRWNSIWARSALVIATLLGVASQARAATPAEVDDAINRGKEYLYRVQKNGNWEQAAVQDANGGPAAVTGGQFGGLTAIATYALLAAGEDPTKKPQLQSAIDWLKKANISGTYALGMRAQIWQFLKPNATGNADLKNMVRRDAQLLAGLIKTQGPSLGFFDYLSTGPNGRYDHSVSQYGVLGMWACANTDFIEIPQRFWSVVEEGWVRDQGPTTGGWHYDEGRGTEAKASMTAAGVATLFITQDFLHSMEGVECTGNVKNPHLDAGLKWMGDHFNMVQDNYTWYGVERIGVASGYKYLGTVDWFKEGSDRLVRTQGKTGEWNGGHGGVPNSCFAMLFLVRGRAPVALNKLEYVLEGAGGAKPVANWNQRSRDAANFTNWLHKQTESYYNWQIVNLKAPVDDMHDSSILYVSGNQPLIFSKDDEKKLREFVDGGGLIVFNADCGVKARPFVDSIMTSKGGPSLAKRLGFDYEWQKLPEDHPIFTNQSYRRSNWKEANTLEIYALTNGSRVLMLLFSINDPARYWQTQTIGGREWAHELMGDIFLYSTDNEPRVKGHTYIVRPKATVKADKTLKVARLQYPQNWDPEPGGWRRMAAIVHNENRLDLTVDTVKLGDGKLSDYKVAHLTGNNRYHLTAPEKEDLKKFMAGGGTLVVDACGGAAEFSDAMLADLKEVLGPDSDQLNVPVKPDNALFGFGGKKLEEFAYRRFAKKLLGNNLIHIPRLRQVLHDKKPICYFSAEDLSIGMVGQEVDGVYGYTPATSTAIMQKILLEAAGITAAPTTKPAGGDGEGKKPAREAAPPRKPPEKKPEKKPAAK